MDATSDLKVDHKQDKNLSDMPKNMGLNLHDTIDKVAEKAKPAIDSLAQSAHKNVERLAFRGGQLGDTYRRYLGASRIYIQGHPLMSVGTVLVLSFAVSKLIRTRHK
jgi:copper homeostasis protein CutC